MWKKISAVVMVSLMSCLLTACGTPSTDNSETEGSGLSDDEQAVSDAMAAAFADYINQAGIKDENGNVLALEESADGIFQAGSYYDYIVGVIEESLNNFLSDTELLIHIFLFRVSRYLNIDDSFWNFPIYFRYNIDSDRNVFYLCC